MLPERTCNYFRKDMSNIFIAYYPHVAKHCIHKAAMVKKESLSLPLSLPLSAPHRHTQSHTQRHTQEEVFGPQLPKLFKRFSAEMPINRNPPQPQKDATAGKGRGEKRSICAVTPYLGTLGRKIQSHTVKSRSSKQTW